MSTYYINVFAKSKSTLTNNDKYLSTNSKIIPNKCLVHSTNVQT